MPTIGTSLTVRGHVPCIRAFLVGVAIFSLGCGEKQEKPRVHSEQQSVGKTANTLRTTAIRVGDISITAEVCDTPESRRRGLMFRSYLSEDAGMLFVFDTEGYCSFWMKDTYIPLSIAFIDRSGTIIQIDDMQPQDLTFHTPPRPVLYALEMNQGWFKENEIKVGDRLQLELNLR